MKKAIVFLMVLGVFLAGVVAIENATTNVGFSFLDGGISNYNFVFTQKDKAVSSASGALAAEDGGNITISTASENLDGTKASTEFNFVWYFYSTQGLTVTLKVGAMQNTAATDVIEAWDILPEETAGSNSSTASLSRIEAPTTVNETTQGQDIVIVSKPNVMTENWGNIKLTGTVDLNGVAPDTYSSAITASISAE